MFVLWLIAPYFLTIAGFWLLLRAAYRSRSSHRPLLLYSLTLSALITVAFIVWGHITAFNTGPTAGTLLFAFLPCYAIGASLIAFVVSWSLVYVAFFVIERTAHRQPKTTGWLLFAVVIVVLLVAGFLTQRFAARSMLLHSAQTATAPESQDQILARALKERDLEVMSRLAQNPAIGEEDLNRLYKACQDSVGQFNPKEYIVFYALAQNPRTPPEILVALAESQEDSTRIAVAENPSTPETTLRQLANDPDDLVRTWLAHNPKLPRDVLVQLTKDTDEVVRNHAKGFMEHRGFDK